MPNFMVIFKTTATTSMEIEADSAEEAQEQADEVQEFPYICAQCSGWGGQRNLELSDHWEQDGEVEPA